MRASRAHCQPIRAGRHRPGAAGEYSKDQKSERFRTLFKQFFDIPAIARFTLGRFWKMAQPDEQNKFLTTFRGCDCLHVVTAFFRI